MSLYDGLDIEDKQGGAKDKKPDVSGWGSSLKLLETQKQIQAKKASMNTKQRRQGHSQTMAPVIDLKRRGPATEEGPLHFNQLTGRLERMDGVPISGSPFVAGEAPTSFLGVLDEYDPFRPNDYETVVKRKREQRQKEREVERLKELEEREKRRRERHNNYSDGEGSDGDEFEKRLKMRREEEDEEESQAEAMKKRYSSAKAAIAPPTSLIQEDVVQQEEQPFREDSPPGPGVFKPFGDPSDSAPGASFGLGGSIASKIMARMGYRDGQGLGKDKQGMSQALLVEKTSKRGGKIIHEKDLPKAPEPPRAELSNANLLRNPSKVMLLRNMVGPGEVDEDLEPETAEECTKYGKVIKCVIFEIPGTDEEEAVRIFVEFERMEAAIKAVVDLNGRYFGGRVVKASFYNLDKFRRLDLGAETD